MMPIVFTLSIVFAASAFVYMAYVGGFFIKQQRYEFLTFEKLGMSKATIVVLGFMQTFVIQVFAWVLGIIEAFIFQKFFGMLLLYLMRVKISFTSYLNLDSLLSLLRIAVTSIFVFSIINAIRTYSIVKKNKPNIKKINIWLRIPTGTFGILLFISAVIGTIALFTTVQDTDSGYSNHLIFESMYVAIAYFAGTYLIYFGFLPVLLTVLQKVKRISYSGLNLFSFKYLKSRTMRNTSVLWFVTELSTMALILLTTCYFGYKLIYENYHTEYPFALTANKNTVEDVKNTIDDSKTEISHQYHSRIKITLVSTLDTTRRVLVQRPASFMSYSEYMNLPKKIRKQNPELGPKQFMRIGFGNDETFGFSDRKVEWNVKNATKIVTRKNGSSFPYGGGMFPGSLMVTPDSYYNKLSSASTDTLYGWYFKHGDKLTKKQARSLVKYRNAYVISVNAKSDLNNSTFKISRYNPDNYTNDDYIQAGFVRQESAKRHLHQIVGFFIFMVAIFSIALLIALGSVLTLRILLRDDYEWRQLKTLKKIGVSDQEIRGIIRSENALTFVIPIVFAILQSYAAIAIVNNGYDSIVPEFTLICLSYVVLYSLIGIVTYMISWRSVKRRIS
ncbi:hypothetical protein BTM29_06750 [Companilactobacillus allii]|uniref:ABC3 transporter permease C-terminal domain-containing protein n=2 Tax=Companilactobacillus allii TaxID=1847728 RepID=A0A1P8Q357_9LACO|nr:hypothetical protein BTM29_06750 [Companilactobacillus allii]